MIQSAIPKLPFIDKALTIDFYIQQLGFELIADYGDYFLIKLDGAELHFFAYPELKPDKSDFMIYLRVKDDIEALYAQWNNLKPALLRLGKLEQKGSVNQTVSSPFPCVHWGHAPNGHMGNKKFSKRASVSSHQT